MKKIITLFTLFIATLSFAQTANKAIAWSGIITDNTGNALANTSVTLKFSITRNGFDSYVEQQIKITDANGFVNANIGEGIPHGGGYNFSFVDFKYVNLKLKIEVDSGSGFVTLSDEFFKAVPYAKGAETARELVKDDELVFLNSNNISFYTNGYQGEINENGLLLDDLAGTGTREVVADANGQLQRKPLQTKYLTISGADFSNSEFIFYPPYYGLIRTSIASGSSVNINAPIHLPHDAKIVNIQFVFKDNSSLRGFTAGLYSTNSSFNNNLIVGLNTNSTPNSSSFQTAVTPNFSYTIDNLNNYYYLNLSSSSWQNDFDLIFHKIVITYEE